MGLHGADYNAYVAGRAAGQVGAPQGLEGLFGGEPGSAVFMLAQQAVPVLGGGAPPWELPPAGGVAPRFTPVCLSLNADFTRYSIRPVCREKTCANQLLCHCPIKYSATWQVAERSRALRQGEYINVNGREQHFEAC